jgi:hypothetical protein
VTLGGVYWPDDVGIGTLPTPAVFTSAFHTEGWSVCADDAFTDNVVKIAFYVDSSGFILHAARQVRGGWTSKLGPQEDVGHLEASTIAGPQYGVVAFFMEKQGELSAL